jgi:hypothetical protein
MYDTAIGRPKSVYYSFTCHVMSFVDSYKAIYIWGLRHTGCTDQQGVKYDITVTPDLTTLN